MLRTETWEAANGILAILGALISVMGALYLARNIHRTYRDPVRLVALSFLAVIFGHTIKDGAAYLAQCCGLTPPAWIFIVAIIIIATGKLGCMIIWADPRWGWWPWLIAVGAVATFLALA